MSTVKKLLSDNQPKTQQTKKRKPRVKDINDQSVTKEGFMQILGEIEPETEKTVMMFGKNRQT